MKKDLIAAITFLATAFLLYLAQTEGTVPQELASESDCAAVEAAAPADQAGGEDTRLPSVRGRIQDT